MAIDKYIEKKHTAGDDVAIIFDDKTGEERSVDKMNEMFQAFRDIANENGFDISSWGNRKTFRRSLKID